MPYTYRRRVPQSAAGAAMEEGSSLLVWIIGLVFRLLALVVRAVGVGTFLIVRPLVRGFTHGSPAHVHALSGRIAAPIAAGIVLALTWMSAGDSSGAVAAITWVIGGSLALVSALAAWTRPMAAAGPRPPKAL